MTKKQLLPIKKGSILRFHTMLGDLAGCGMIRVMFPYLHLSQYRSNFKTIPTYDQIFVLDGNYYKNLHFLQFQRSATKGQFEVLKSLKQNITCKTGTKIVYEIDDDITGVPDWNYASIYYNQHKDYIFRFLESVDFIICSTDHLAKKLNKFNKTKVIKNRLSFHWQGILKKEVPSIYKKKILWAGSQNHFSIDGLEGDFDDKLLNYIKDTSEKFEWIFVGGIPNQLKNVNVKKYGWINYLNFPNFLSSLKADIGIAPLQNVPFNESKSNIKALEFAALGIPGIYSNVEPYKNMSLLANNSDDFINHIENLTNDNKLWSSIRYKDHETLKDELFWNDDYCKFYLNKYLSEIERKV